MNDYYDRVETQLRALTERGAHRRTRVRVAPMVAVVAATAVVIAVAGVFFGVRSRSHTPPLSPAPACTRADWRMTGISARRLDGATVAGVSISSTRTCHLRLDIAFDLVNRSGALAGAVGARVDTSLAPGVTVERRWGWRNSCGYPLSSVWFRLSGGGRTVRVPVSPPPCVDRHDTTGFGLFELGSPSVLSAHGIGPVRLAKNFSSTLSTSGLEELGNLLAVWGHPTAGRGCGVDRGEKLLDGIELLFGRGRFVGYEYSGRFLATTKGLRVGDTIARALHLYRDSTFTTSPAQGGSWSAGGLHGYLTAPKNGRIATIDAGNLGCAALTS